MTMLVAVVITENGCGRTEFLWLWGQKNRRHTKGDGSHGREWARSEIRTQVPSVT